jgi:hypothetical protein
MTLALVFGSALFPRLAASQTAARPASLVETLNKEAEAADPAGIHKYSQHLIQLLVGDNAGKAYASSLTNRLATAELMAREGKGKLVAEADVARSFNDLMEQIGAPASLRTDEGLVQKFRAGPLAKSPVSALITADRNGVDCNPGEAVFLMWLLLANNGKGTRFPDGWKPEDLPRMAISIHPPTEPNAWRLLSTYYSQHSRIDTVKLFEDAAQTLGL